MKKEKQAKTKKHLKWQIKLILIILLVVLYSVFIGTKGIFIKEYKIKTEKIDTAMHGFKILQFSDLHYGSSVDEKIVIKLVNKINETKPDVVIFTGDLIDKKHKLTIEEKEILIKNLSKINAELGKYYITGNEDTKESISILNLSSFINIDSKEQLIYSSSSYPIILFGKDTTENCFDANKELPYFKMLALHNPNDIKKYKDYNLDIVISGHTLNGLINIPKIKDLLIDGDYKNSYQKVNNTKLFINPGIGTSKIKARLFNHPTIYLYRLNKTST